MKNDTVFLVVAVTVVPAVAAIGILALIPVSVPIFLEIMDPTTTVTPNKRQKAIVTVIIVVFFFCRLSFNRNAAVDVNRWLLMDFVVLVTK